MSSPVEVVSTMPVGAGHRVKIPLGRLIRIGLAIVLLAVGAAIYGPQLIYTHSSDGVLNARIITVAAPIDGRVVKALPPEGTLVLPGAPLLTIENPVVDRGRLEELEATLTRTQAERAGARHLAEELATQLEKLDEQLTAYRVATVARLSLAAREAEADAVAAAATAADARHNYERKRALRAASTISLAEVDQAGQAAIRAEAVAERTRLTVQRLGEELEAAKKGVFVGEDRNDVPYSQQRADELRVRKAEAEVQGTTLEARLVQLGEQVAAERTRAARLTATELEAPAAGVVWRPLVAAGSAVARNSELMTLIDCSELYATVSFSGRRFDDVNPGRRAVVHVLGTDIEYPATVVDTRAVQRADLQDRFAAPLPKLDDRQILALLRLDDPRNLAAEKYCSVGRHVEVRFTEGIDSSSRSRVVRE